MAFHSFFFSEILTLNSSCVCSNSDTNILLKFESFLGGSIDRP